MKANSILKSYLLFSVFYLALPFFGFEEISWYLKPLLLPFLIVAVGISADFDTKKTVIYALCFSWFGDIILMFADKAEIFFILGLVSFLISHLIYIRLFPKQHKKQIPLRSATVSLGFFVILGYFATMITVLFPKLGPLQIPVTIYAIVITTMLYVAFRGSLQWEKPAANSILTGAIFFVLSDSILAFNKFYQALPQSGFWIMSTYCIAQYLIVSGVLQLNQKK